MLSISSEDCGIFTRGTFIIRNYYKFACTFNVLNRELIVEHIFTLSANISMLTVLSKMKGISLINTMNERGV